VGTVVFEASEPDHKTRQLASALNLFRTKSMDGFRQALNAGGYLYFVDLPAHQGQPRGSETMYWIYVEDVIEPDFPPVCEVSPGVTVGGIVAYLSPGPATKSIPMRMLGSRDRALLEKLCNGLRQPLSALRSGTSSHRANGEHTVYDYLVRSSPVLIIALMPGRMQGQDVSTGIARHLWGASLIERYNRVPAGEEMMANPEAFEQLTALQNGQVADFPMPSLPGFQPNVANDTYPRAARREFGKRIDTLDADWARYLGAAAVTIRGRQVPLMRDGKPVAVLPIYSQNEIGTPAFWLSSNDVVRTYEMVACIGGRFLSDRYQLDASQADMGRCAISETSLSPQ
jgi:hypothetical protein